MAFRLRPVLNSFWSLLVKQIYLFNRYLKAATALFNNKYIQI
jgi:hypothetical protein